MSRSKRRRTARKIAPRPQAETSIRIPCLFGI
jgi:hypothetical protein